MEQPGLLSILMGGKKRKMFFFGSLATSAVSENSNSRYNSEGTTTKQRKLLLHKFVSLKLSGSTAFCKRRCLTVFLLFHFLLKYLFGFFFASQVTMVWKHIQSTLSLVWLHQNQMHIG